MNRLLASALLLLGVAASVPAEAAAWEKIADENQPFILSGPATVRFGSGTAWLQKEFKSGAYSCSLASFGSDPAVNVYKQCEVRTAETAAQAAPSTSDRATLSAAPPSGLQATRDKCTAPCAVLFDASALGDFRTTIFSFDFGDERGQKWAVSGLPKNTQVGGPIAAHVYEVPGTYTAKVAGATATIVVDDPDKVYAGTKTVCIGRSYAGCPAGAAQQSSLPSGTSWSGKRWLLQAGETFGDISILDGNANVQVGRYGSGAKPVVGTVGIGNWRPRSASFPTDITVMDLDVKNQVSQSLGSRVLVLRNDIHVTPGSGGIPVSMGQVDYWYRGDASRTVAQSAFHNAREIFVVENEAIGSDTRTGVAGVWGDGSRIALLGNRFGRYQQHSIRFSALDRSVIAHNEVQGISADGMRHALKLHSMGFNAYADGAINDTSGRGGWKTSKVVIANNLFGNAQDNNAWTITVAPQNNTVGEGIEDVIVENNRFVHGRNTSADIIVMGRRITVRGNSVAGGGKLLIGDEPNPEVPPEWKRPNFVQSP